MLESTLSAVSSTVIVDARARFTTKTAANASSRAARIMTGLRSRLFLRGLKTRFSRGLKTRFSRGPKTRRLTGTKACLFFSEMPTFMERPRFLFCGLRSGGVRHHRSVVVSACSLPFFHSYVMMGVGAGRGFSRKLDLFPYGFVYSRFHEYRKVKRSFARQTKPLERSADARRGGRCAWRGGALGATFRRGRRAATGGRSARL